METDIKHNDNPGIRHLSPLEMNNIKLTVSHTPITPQELKEDAAKNIS